MIPELARTLDPLVAAVQDAEHALDQHNRDRHAHPLDGLHLAGRALKAHQELSAAMYELLDSLGTADTYETRMRIHGRVRTLAEENTQ